MSQQTRLVEGLGGERQSFDSGEHGRRKLYRLIRSRRCLLVLDDVRCLHEAVAFDAVGEEGRLLLTRREREVLAEFGADTQEVDVLPPAQALILLARSAGAELGDLPDEARDVARACGYLPLALAVAGALANPERGSWRGVLDRLESVDLASVRSRFPGHSSPETLRALQVAVAPLDDPLRRGLLLRPDTARDPDRRGHERQRPHPRARGGRRTLIEGKGDEKKSGTREDRRQHQERSLLRVANLELRCDSQSSSDPNDGFELARRSASVKHVTRILAAIEDGNPRASEELLPLVYDELRRLASTMLAHEKPGQTLQATALVHEAYIRLVDTEQTQSWNSRGHFFAAAAEAIRRILIDQARRKRRPKHGGGLRRVDLADVRVVSDIRAEELLSLDDALEKLAAQSPEKAEFVKLRYFAGMSVQEAADVLGISRATADRFWSYAKVFLYSEMEGAAEE